MGKETLIAFVAGMAVVLGWHYLETDKQADQAAMARAIAVRSCEATVAEQEAELDKCWDKLKISPPGVRLKFDKEGAEAETEIPILPWLMGK